MPTAKKVPVLKIILVVWLAFSTLYFLYSEYSRLSVFVAQRAYNSGINTAINQLIDQAQNCQPIPITSASKSIQVINVSCLSVTEDDSNSGQ